MTRKTTSDGASDNVGRGQILRYDAARQALAEAHRIDDVQEIRDKAIAVAEYARRAKDGALIAMATEIKLYAERRAGELLREMEKDRGGNPNLSPRGDRLTLRDLGITRNQSSAWQRLAGIPNETFSRHLGSIDLATVTTRKVLGALLRDVRRVKNQADAPTSSRTCTVDDLDKLVTTGQAFGTIYADPPWLYDNQGTRAATDNHYEGMKVADLCNLPVGKLAAADAHLHLWTTNAFLFECPRLFDAWGFEFRSSFVWVKSQIGIGNYWRNSHEFLLTAIRGDARSFADKTLRSWIECGRGKHSSKPDVVREMVERASPGPRLELFGRRQVEGWTVWGDQIDRDLFYRERDGE